MTRFQRKEYDTIDSTNLEALRLWKAGGSRQTTLVVRAQSQSSGRGRHGRVWQSPRGGLWFSVLWPLKKPTVHYQGVSLAVGLATARALESACGLTTFIKWPNDLVIPGPGQAMRKIAGILCQVETRGTSGALISGIGINGNFPAAILEGNFKVRPTTLLEELGTEADLDRLMDFCLREFDVVFTEFDTSGLQSFLPEFNERLAWRDRVVTVESQTLQTGRLVGISPEGHLLLNREGQVQSLVSGELIPPEHVEGSST